MRMLGHMQPKAMPPNDMQLCIYSWAIMIWSLGYTGGILDVADVWLQKNI